VHNAIQERVSEAIDLDRIGEANLTAYSASALLRALGVETPTNAQCHIPSLPHLTIQPMAIRRPLPRPTGRTDRVYLVQWPHCYRRELDRFWGQVGTIDGTIGDEVLVRFGEIVVQVPPDMLEPADQ